MQFGLLAVLNNDEIASREAQMRGEVAPVDQFAGLITRMEGYVESCWQAAKSAKESSIEMEMLDSLRQREGVYSPDKLTAIRGQGGSEIFMMLTNVKCRAAEGWIRDILLPAGERPFTVKPSPVPDDLPEDTKSGIYSRVMAAVQQAIQSGVYPTEQQVYERARSMYDEQQTQIRDEAKTLASRMEDGIDDLLVEGQWYEAMSDMISDLVTHHAGFIKGPVMRKEARLAWSTDPKTGKPAPQATNELVPVFYSPSPLDIYPAPDSKGINDGYLFERMPLRRSALQRMRDVPGYSKERIEAALAEYQHKGHDLGVGADQTRRELENADQWQNTPDHTIDAVEFHGSVRGEWLIEWGMDAAQVPDPAEEYEVTALRVGRFTVRCVLNEDPLGRRPYDKASYDVVKGQFWGRGLPMLIRDLQNMCNAAARALANNMGIASGPLVEVEVDRLAEGEDITQLFPWKIFQTKASKTTPGAAVRFHDVPHIVEPLMKVYGYFAGLADNYSGIPSYEQGINQTTGAAGTASGLSMLMTAASRQIKRIIAAIDAMTVGSVKRAHTHIMLYGDKPEMKGDANIVARGASSLVAKEQQQMRRTQFLQTTANPIDAPLLGPVTRAELLRETMRSLDLNPEAMGMPSKDEMLAQMRQAAQMQAQQAQMQQQRQLPAPAAQDPAGNPAGGTDTALF